MVHHQKNYYYQQLRKGQVLLNDFMKEDHRDEESQSFSSLARGHANSCCYCKRAKPRLQFVILLSLLFCSLFWLSRLFGFHCSFPLSYSLRADSYVEMDSQMGPDGPLCSSITNGTICCDRTSMRSDICFMKGDIRTNSTSSTVFLYSTPEGKVERQTEKIKPYTRKWETSVMNTIEELNLVSKPRTSLDVEHHKCDLWHDVPAVVFSTGGYTGNVYHEFNDGILPLYITAQHFNKKVVFVILEYHDWWFTKYGDILSLLSDYTPIDFNGDKRTHCFSQVIVGLRIHDELTIDSSKMEGNKTIRDFHALLDRAYWPRIRSMIEDEERKQQLKLQQKTTASSTSSTEPRAAHEYQQTKPILTILSRKGSRAITNQLSVVRLAEGIGFQVKVLNPDRRTEMAKIYRELNSSDAMMGVHGAALTHFMFLKPGGVFIQVIPLGTEWAAETYYGEPAMKFGLRYIRYKIRPKESSLYKHYDKVDPVLADPKSVAEKGWQFTKKIYLDNQTVKLDLRRFKKHLVRAYEYSVSRKQRQIRYKNNNHSMS
ncbi:hypothetical protein Dimus_002028 [Dionaea muscipula]